MKSEINSIRDFNRFYVSLIGVMKNNVLDLEYSLTESRVIFEIDRERQITAREIKDKIFLDEGYLSRLIKRLVKDGVISKQQSEKDKRIYFLVLTTKGKEIANIINLRSDNQIEVMIENLKVEEKNRVVELMTELKSILSLKNKI